MRHQMEYAVSDVDPLRTTHKTVRSIDEFHWTFTVRWSIRLQPGTDRDAAITLLTNASAVNVTTLVAASPRAAHRECDPISANVTWFAQRFGNVSDAAASFQIDRSKASCRTPSNNEDVAAAVQCFVELHDFCNALSNYFLSLAQLFRNGDGDDAAAAATTPPIDITPLFAEDVFIPLLPVCLLSH